MRAWPPVRRTERRKYRKMHCQEFWDSCAQNKTSVRKEDKHPTWNTAPARGVIKRGVPGLGPWARSKTGPSPARTSYLHGSTRLAQVSKSSVERRKKKQEERRNRKKKEETERTKEKGERRKEKEGRRKKQKEEGEEVRRKKKKEERSKNQE